MKSIRKISLIAGLVVLLGTLNFTAPAQAAVGENVDCGCGKIIYGRGKIYPRNGVDLTPMLVTACPKGQCTKKTTCTVEMRALVYKNGFLVKEEYRIIKPTCFNHDKRYEKETVGDALSGLLYGLD